MLVLKLHVEIDSVTAKSDIVRRVGCVAKGQIEAKLPGVELDRLVDVARADDRLGLLEHCRL
jgi:hypothetical protein